MSSNTNCQPIKDFKNETIRINILINNLISLIKIYDKTKDDYFFLKNGSPIELQSLDVKSINNIYELGYIRLYASFEAFMYLFLKYLYTKYPNSIPVDKKLSVEDVLHWKTKKSIYVYVIDHVAIENSRDIDTWDKILKDCFNINVFRDQNQKRSLKILNIFRNILAHSGCKFTSKTIRDFKRELSPKTNSNLKINTKMEFDQRIFEILYEVLNSMISNIEASLLRKRTGTNLKTVKK